MKQKVNKNMIKENEFIFFKKINFVNKFLNKKEFIKTLLNKFMCYCSYSILKHFRNHYYKGLFKK